MELRYAYSLKPVKLRALKTEEDIIPKRDRQAEKVCVYAGMEGSKNQHQLYLVKYIVFSLSLLMTQGMS